MVTQTEKSLVLVIDDDVQILDLIKNISEGTEFNVLLASDAHEGVKIAIKYNPSIILLDIIMPNIDGFITCKTLKRNIKTKNIPVIFMTGETSKENIVKAIKEGASDYIEKPFTTIDVE